MEQSAGRVAIAEIIIFFPLLLFFLQLCVTFAAVDKCVILCGLGKHFTWYPHSARGHARTPPSARGHPFSARSKMNEIVAKIAVSLSFAFAECIVVMDIELL